MKLLLGAVSIFASLGCSSTSDSIRNLVTSRPIEIERFMGDWYVLAGRFTFLEVDVHNGIETYSWNKDKKQIDVAFTYNKGSFQGPLKSIPQKAWVYNEVTKSHWKVSPLWPFKFDYLILDIDEHYTWTAIGVPNQKYLWIMARSWKNTDELVKEILQRLKAKGYNTENIVNVPHQWPRD
jgi:apolipoprotein D and lipocalin family protein